VHETKNKYSAYLLTSVIDSGIQFDDDWTSNDLLQKVTRCLFSTHCSVS